MHLGSLRFAERALHGTLAQTVRHAPLLLHGTSTRLKEQMRPALEVS
jgi:hypothetical protein